MCISYFIGALYVWTTRCRPPSLGRWRGAGDFLASHLTARDELSGRVDWAVQKSGLPGVGRAGRRETLHRGIAFQSSMERKI
jgi:hypothetical protein